MIIVGYNHKWRSTMEEVIRRKGEGGKAQTILSKEKTHKTSVTVGVDMEVLQRVEEMKSQAIL